MFKAWFIKYSKHVFWKRFKASMCFKLSLQTCFYEPISVCSMLLFMTLCVHSDFSLLMWRLKSLCSLYINEGAIRCGYVEKDTVRTVPLLREMRLWRCGVPTPMFHVKNELWICQVKFMKYFSNVYKFKYYVSEMVSNCLNISIS